MVTDVPAINILFKASFFQNQTGKQKKYVKENHFSLASLIPASDRSKKHCLFHFAIHFYPNFHEAVYPFAIVICPH